VNIIAKVKNQSIVSIVLAVCFPAFGQDKPVAASDTTPPASSAGLVNDLLRQHYPAATNWNIGGEERLRYENRQGYGIAGVAGSVDFRGQGADVYNDYLLNRLRFHAGYGESWWSAYAEGQSSAAFGDERFAYANTPPVAGTVRKQGEGPESNTIDLHQAYFTVGNEMEFPISLKAGRQELVYGEERLIGAANWNNIGRAFDSAKVRWTSEWLSVDAFTGCPVIPEDWWFDLDNIHDWFSGVYATSTKLPTTIVEAYFLARNSSRDAINFEPSPQFLQPTARDIYTIGGRLKSKPGELGNWDYAVEGAYQFGDFAATATSARLTQDAYMFVVQGGYTFADLWATPRLGAEFDYSSGDGNASDGTHGTLDNLFPTNHKFYGWLDFVSLQNIQDLGVSLTLKPAKRLTVSLLGNAFWLANSSDYFYNVNGAPRTAAGYGIHPAFDSFVGTELTAVAGYSLARFAHLEVGYGHFFTGNYVQQSLVASGGDKDADWFYTQLTVKF
jgi:hypothetical protein